MVDGGWWCGGCVGVDEGRGGSWAEAEVEASALAVTATVTAAGTQPQFKVAPFPIQVALLPELRTLELSELPFLSGTLPPALVAPRLAAPPRSPDGPGGLLDDGVVAADADIDAPGGATYRRSAYGECEVLDSDAVGTWRARPHCRRPYT